MVHKIGPPGVIHFFQFIFFNQVFLGMKRYFFTFFFSGMKFRPTPRGDQFFLGENLFNKIFFGIEKKITSKCFRELLSDFPLKESSGGGIQFCWDFLFNHIFWEQKKRFVLNFFMGRKCCPQPPNKLFSGKLFNQFVGNA